MLVPSDVRDGEESPSRCTRRERDRKDCSDRAANLWKPRGWSGEWDFLSFCLVV